MFKPRIKKWLVCAVDAAGQKQCGSPHYRATSHEKAMAYCHRLYPEASGYTKHAAIHNGTICRDSVGRII